MKILQILPELNTGGVERGTVDLGRELLHRNHQALVVSNGGSLVAELESAGVRHIRLPVHRKSLFSVLWCVPRLARILRQEKVDIVHARSRVPGLIGFLACRRTGTKFVTTCHGYYSKNFFSRIMGWGEKVIVSSSAIARHMIEDFGVPEERIRLIPRGVNLEEFKFNLKSQAPNLKSAVFTIGVIGRLTPIKGQKYFLQALARVIRVVPRVRALIVGDISPGKEKYKEELLMLSRRLSLDRYVEFMGRQNNIPRVLSRLDVLVLPTVTQEAFGRVLIEAGASGVPVIATRVGGVVDIIQDGVNGILVEPQNPAGLATGLIRLFQEPKLRQKLALAGRKRVEADFSLQQMAEKTIRLYEEVRTTLKILVIKLAALGDVILAGPALKALREKFPKSQISVLVATPFKPILANCPYIDDILELPWKNKGYRIIWRLGSRLRRLGFDIIIDLQNNRRSHLLAYLSAANQRYGYANGKFGFLLNKTVKEADVPLSPVEHQARTLRLLGVESLRENLELWPQESDQAWAEDFLNKQRNNPAAPLIGINLGASPRWPSKRWGVLKFSAVLDKLQDAGMEVLITGKGRDKELAQGLRQLSSRHFIDAVEKTTVMQLACLVRRCNVYITGDSALLHIAYAMDTPVVALFGPTDPRRHTLTNARQVIVKKDLACSPCYKRRCRQHHCMEEISAEEVFTAVKKLLK